MQRRLFDPSCSRNSRSLPFEPTRMCPWMWWSEANSGRSHVAQFRVAHTVRNRTRYIRVCRKQAELLALTASGDLRRKGSGAIAHDKNDCSLPLRRQLCRIPSEVSDGNPYKQRLEQKRRKRRTLPVRTNPDGNRSGLTNSFRKGHIRPG
jgi:hypothetical protein